MPPPTGPPSTTPLGLHLSRTARTVGRAFDAALAEAGGSLSTWLVLLNLKIAGKLRQRDLAAAVGLSEPTLTHHLSALERDGLVARHRAEDNRRVQLVQLSRAGEERFLVLAQAAIAFDARLRDGLSAEEDERLRALLDRLAANVGGADTQAPWAGLIRQQEGEG